MSSFGLDIGSVFKCEKAPQDDRLNGKMAHNVSRLNFRLRHQSGWFWSTLCSAPTLLVECYARFANSGEAAFVICYSSNFSSLSIFHTHMKIASSSKRPAHLEWPLLKWLRVILAGGGAWSLFLLYVYIFRNGRFDLILQFSAPVLAIYIASSGLMYNRARGMPQGKAKRRSLYAGERATQAFLFTVIGLLLGLLLSRCWLL